MGFLDRLVVGNLSARRHMGDRQGVAFSHWRD